MNSAVNTSFLMMITYLPSLLISLGITVLVYVLEALAVQTIAKRRGIRNPWLAWLPIGGAWMWGCVSDQFQYVALGRVRNKRKALLILSIVQTFLTLFVCFQVLRILGGLASISVTRWNTLTDEQVIDLLLPPILSMAGVMLLSTCLGIASTVIQYICLYDIYRSADPGNGAIFLLLSIFLQLPTPFLLFAVRNKDDGMPPRQDQVPPQPTWTPQPPAWEADPSKEPWEQ